MTLNGIDVEGKTQMATFKFNCPQCGQEIEADEAYRGQVAECPHCSKGIVVPRSKPKLGLTPPAARQKNAISPSVATKATVSPQALQTKCPHCGTMYEVERSEYGKRAKCEDCGKSFTIGLMPQNKKSFWKTFCATEGRATRGEWWKLWVKVDLPIIAASVLMFIVTVVRCESMADNSNIDGMMSAIMACWICIILLVLASCILMTPVTVRRLHDRNMSGWWLLVFSLLPFGIWAEILIVRCLAGMPGENDYGPASSGDCGRGQQTKMAVIGVVLAIMFVVIVIFILALPSTTLNQEDVSNRLVDRQAQSSSVVQQEDTIQNKVEASTATDKIEPIQSSSPIRNEEDSAQIEVRKERIQELRQKFDKIEKMLSILETNIEKLTSYVDEG